MSASNVTCVHVAHFWHHVTFVLLGLVQWQHHKQSTFESVHALRLVAFKLHRSDNVVACIENLDRVCVLIFEILSKLVALYVIHNNNNVQTLGLQYAHFYSSIELILPLLFNSPTYLRTNLHVIYIIYLLICIINISWYINSVNQFIDVYCLLCLLVLDRASSTAVSLLDARQFILCPSTDVPLD